MTTRVHLTIDTEFSIAGAFGDPDHCRPVGPPAVYCRIGDAQQGSVSCWRRSRAMGEPPIFLEACYSV